MRKKIYLLVIILYATTNVFAQTIFNPKIDRDSLFEKILEKYPDNNSKKELKENFYKANNNGKEYLIAVLYDTNYEKKDLIDNYERNQKNLSNLKKEYSKLVPKNYIVQVTFNNSEILIPKKTISIDIYKIKDGYLNDFILSDKSNIELISSNHNLIYETKKLSEVLEKLKWDEDTLKKIEIKLQLSNCYSIRNGNPSLVQFKQIGFGVLSYKFFNENLTNQEIIENNDGCNFIYYKDNVVLVSDNGQDGARGALCFP